MGTVADKLSYLLETKQLIKEAIEYKGITVAEDAEFRQYADLIRSIINQADSELAFTSCITGVTARKPYKGIIVSSAVNPIISSVPVSSSLGMVFVTSAAVKIGTLIVEEVTE